MSEPVVIGGLQLPGQTHIEVWAADGVVRVEAWVVGADSAAVTCCAPAAVIEAGIPSKAIEVSDVDTFTDSRFASHRRSAETGEPEWRHACVVAMAEEE